MISVQEAESIILSSMPKMAPCSIDIRQALGEVLSEDLIADRDFPPFNRVAMDGVAIDSRQFKPKGKFLVQGMQRAGEAACCLKNPEHCIEVMTGCSLPAGCDAVIPYEQLTITAGEAQLDLDSVSAWQYIHRQASDQPQGSVVLKAGSRMGPAELAVAAAIGRQQLPIFRRPRIALVSTGDELVDIADTPKSHQIRRSNEYAIDAALRKYGFCDINWHHCPDDESSLTTTIGELLEYNDVLIFSGGVSAGKFDLLPKVLVDLGVTTKFHKVRQRPGKPMYFGVHHLQKAIFGLPGNPVSALTTFFRYVLPALKQCIGNRPSAKMFAKLSEDINFPVSLTLFRAIKLKAKPDGSLWAEPIANNGSGDFTSLCGSDGFLELDAKFDTYSKSSLHPLWQW